MAEETIPGGSTALPSVLDSFRGNKVYGRLLTCELPSPPPRLLTRKPGRCSEPLEKAQKAYEDKSFFDKLLTPKDGWGNPKDQHGPKWFKQQCEQWPDQMPESFLDEQQQRLNDHLSGRISLPPEESLRLRRDLSLLNDMYRPGPRYEASLSAAEQSWLDERNLRFGNSLAMAFLGPIFGGPAAATRVLGGTEQQVAAANQMGAIVLDLATTHSITGGKPSARSPTTYKEYARGAPLEPVTGSVGGPKASVVAKPRLVAPPEPKPEVVGGVLISKLPVHVKYEGTGPLFRGDGRSPETIFKEGFKSRGENTNLEKYQRENTPSVYVPTSTSENVGAEFASYEGPGSFVYKIDPRGLSGVDINATLGNRSLLPHELEIGVIGSIPSTNIISARPLLPNGDLGPAIPNPNYRGGD